MGRPANFTGFSLEFEEIFLAGAGTKIQNLAVFFDEHLSCS